MSKANKSNKAIKYRLYPNDEQKVMFAKTFGCCRFVYNQLLALQKQRYKEELQSNLNLETTFMEEIASIMKSSNFDIMFITGVGEVFPYIRSHNILNNLQKVARENPTVMFYPGDYKHSLEKGTSLELFELLRDDKYYRAFNIYHYEI